MQDSRYLGRSYHPESLRKAAGEFSISGGNDPTIEPPAQHVLQYSLTDKQVEALLTPRPTDGVQPTHAQVVAERAIQVMTGIITDITER